MRRNRGAHEDGFNHVSEADGGFLIRWRRTILMTMNAEHKPTANDQDTLTAREAGLRALVDTLTTASVGPDEIARQIAAFEEAWRK